MAFFWTMGMLEGNATLSWDNETILKTHFIDQCSIHQILKHRPTTTHTKKEAVSIVLALPY